MNITKSTAPLGNQAKHASYVYAFSQINKAIEAEYYLEAITIAESIITDRLLSYGEYLIKANIGDNVTLGAILKKVRKNKVSSLSRETEELLDEVNQWRVKRNICVHSVAKSKPGTATTPVSNFLIQSKYCALDGKKLARKVSAWHKRLKAIKSRSN